MEMNTDFSIPLANAQRHNHSCDREHCVWRPGSQPAGNAAACAQSEAYSKQNEIHKSNDDTCCDADKNIAPTAGRAKRNGNENDNEAIPGRGDPAMQLSLQ